MTLKKNGSSRTLAERKGLCKKVSGYCNRQIYLAGWLNFSLKQNLILIFENQPNKFGDYNSTKTRLDLFTQPQRTATAQLRRVVLRSVPAGRTKLLKPQHHQTFRDCPLSFHLQIYKIESILKGL